MPKPRLQRHAGLTLSGQKCKLVLFVQLLARLGHRRWTAADCANRTAT
jgi:hypothetical protein